MAAIDYSLKRPCNIKTQIQDEPENAGSIMEILTNHNFANQYVSLDTCLSTPKDVTIICKNGTLRAHRVILRNAVPMLNDILEEQVYFDSVVMIPDFDVSFVSSWVQFIYSGKWAMLQREKTELNSFMKVLKFDMPVKCSKVFGKGIKKRKSVNTSITEAEPNEFPNESPQSSSTPQQLKRLSIESSKSEPRAKVRKRSMSSPNSNSLSSPAVSSTSNAGTPLRTESDITQVNTSSKTCDVTARRSSTNTSVQSTRTSVASSNVISRTNTSIRSVPSTSSIPVTSNPQPIVIASPARLNASVPNMSTKLNTSVPSTPAKLNASVPSTSTKLNTSVPSTPAKLNASVPRTSTNVNNSIPSTSTANFPSTSTANGWGEPVKKTAKTNVTYKCRVCFAIFLCSRDLKIHNDSAHPDVTKYECEFCDQSFPQLKTLTGHISKVHSRPRVAMVNGLPIIKDTLHVCPVCDKRFQYSSTLLKHLKQHPGAEGSTDKKVFTCSVCHDEFENKSLLFHHKKKEHFLLNCKLCDLTFKSQEDFATHVKLNSGTHGPIKMVQGTFLCPTCCKEFKEEALCTQHIQMHMQFQKKVASPKKVAHGNTCQFCKLTFYSKVMYRKHIDICVKKTHTCPSCKIVFSKVKEIQGHMRLGKCKKAKVPIAKQPEVNNTTAQTIPSSSYIIKKDRRTCFAYQCNREFPDYQTMNEHAQSHPKNVQFQCTICKAFFPNRRNTLIHRLGAHYNLNYQCEVCQKLFFEHNAVVNHKAKFHNENNADNVLPVQVATVSNDQLPQLTRSDDSDVIVLS